MKNILIITQRVDETNDLLGFFVKWLKNFSERFDNVFVITIGKGKYSLPDNVFVYSLGHEKRASKFKKIWRFYKLIFRFVPKSSAVFSHMSPIFVILSWPVVKLFGKKIIFWYSHREVTLKLRMAAFFSDKILTSSDSSFILNTPKKMVTGHGIDTDYFRPKQTGNISFKKTWKIVSIGRISPIKDYFTTIKAIGLLKNKGYDVNLEIIGRPIYPKDREYLEEMKKMISDLKLEKAIRISDFIPYNQLAPVYNRADILVNGSPTGGLDKVVLEAMASGLAVFVSNKGFSEDFGIQADKFIFSWNDPVDLASKIEAYIKNPFELGFLRDSVIKRHNIDNIMDKIDEITTK